VAKFSVVELAQIPVVYILEIGISFYYIIQKHERLLMFGRSLAMHLYRARLGTLLSMEFLLEDKAKQQNNALYVCRAVQNMQTVQNMLGSADYAGQCTICRTVQNMQARTEYVVG